jgi:hypothetical protein
VERKGCEVAAHTNAAFIFLLSTLPILPSWPDLLSAFAFAFGRTEVSWTQAQAPGVWWDPPSARIWSEMSNVKF